jgi:hypothetical protein
MDKGRVNALRKFLNNSIKMSRSALIEMTSVVPLITFDKEFASVSDESEEWDELQDEIYDMPIGYSIGKYNEYFQGAVLKVHGKDVTIFLTGEEWGELRHIEVDDLPIESVSALLEMIEDNMGREIMN